MLRKTLFLMAIALSVQLPVAQRVASASLDGGHPFSVTSNAEPGYKYLGVGKMTDGFICNVIRPSDGSSFEATWDVDVYELEGTPGVIYVKNPYGEGYPHSSSFTSDFTEDRWMEINVSNPERVFIKEYYSGLSWETTPISMLTMSEYYREYFDDDMLAAAGYFGSFSDNTVTVSMQAVMLKLGTGAQQGYLNVSDFKLVMPEVASGDYSFSMRAITNGAEVYDISGDVDHIEYTVADASTITEEVLKGKLVARSSDIVIQSTSEAGPLDMSVWEFEAGKEYIVAAASYDESDVAQETVCVTFSAEEATYKYLGVGKMTDGFICNVVRLSEVPTLEATWDVDVYELESTPGVIYVKNAYGEGYPHNSAFTSDFTEDRWMEINISNPERVYVKESYSGLSWMSNQLSPMTASEFYKAYFTDDELAAAGYFGSYSDGTITVLTQAAMVKIGPQAQAGYLGVSDFKLVLPDASSGVETVTTAESESVPAEYFDLSGRRIFEPATGIYIVKRGAKVTKEVIRR